MSCALLSGLENVTAVVDSRRQAVARNFALRLVLRYAQRIFIWEIRVPQEYFCHRRNAFVMKDKKYRSAHKVCAQAVPVTGTVHRVLCQRRFSCVAFSARHVQRHSSGAHTEKLASPV